MGRGFTQGKLIFFMALGTDFGSILMAFGTILEHGVPLISSPVPSDDMAMLTQAAEQMDVHAKTRRSLLPKNGLIFIVNRSLDWSKTRFVLHVCALSASVFPCC